MKTKAIVPLVLALALGLLAAYLLRDVLNQRLAGLRQPPSGKAVVVRRDLPLGHELQPEDVALVDAPASLAPKGSFSATEKAVGRVLAAAVAQGQMLAEAMLAPEGSLAGLEAAVPRGMRAVSIDINEVTGLAGLIGPGAFVDVVTTLRDDASGETVGRTILQNVKVSAVGQRIAPKTDPKGMVVNDVSKSATLIVTPEQAEALDVAATRAKLRLILRNSRDTAEVETPGVKLTTLVRPNGGTAGMLEAGGRLMQQFALAMQQARQSAPPPPPATRPSAPAAPPPPAPQKLFVQVIRAGTETTKEFQLQPDADGQPSGPTSETATKGGSPGASIAQDGR